MDNKCYYCGQKIYSDEFFCRPCERKYELMDEPQEDFTDEGEK